MQAASDSHLWSQAYDRELDDIFAVQDDIAQSVVQELRSALLGEQADAAASARVREQVRAATRGRTLNAQAHELYLLGRFLVDRMNPDDTDRHRLLPAGTATRPALCARVGRPGGRVLQPGGLFLGADGTDVRIGPRRGAACDRAGARAGGGTHGTRLGTDVPRMGLARRRCL